MVKFYNDKHKVKVEQYGTFKYNYSIKVIENGTNRIKVNVTHLYCMSEIIIRLENFNKYINKCKNCCGCYEKSIAYHIEVELGLDLDDIWNWKKNNENGINPYYISCGSNREIWLYCQEYDYHNYDRGGNKVGYKTKCSRFYKGHRCSFCGNSGETHWKDSLAYNYPQIAKMIAIEENNLTFEDCYNIACQSNKKFYFKCLDCNTINKKPLSSVVNQRFSCDYCSDGISIPNKILRQISKQLGLKWSFEYSPKWLTNKRLDAYDNNLRIAIEMDGFYKENHIGKRKEVDDWKDEQCLDNDIYVIRIDLMDKKEYSKNTFGYIKSQIIKSELNTIYDLSNIDWKLAWEQSQKSLCIETWKLWNEGMEIFEICNILNLCRSTVRKYLKEGSKSKNVKYDIKEQKQKNRFKEETLYLIDLEGNKIEITLKELCKLLNISDDTYYNNIVKNDYIISSLKFSKQKRPYIYKYDGYKISKK